MCEELHTPVLVDEAVSYLRLKENGFYLDGTVGLGGHTIAILKAMEGKINVLAVDQDQKSLKIASERINKEGFKECVYFVNGRFSDFPIFMKRLGWEKLDGALLDLGISSFQLSDEEKGLSFLQDSPLDMRLSPSMAPVSAKDIVNSYEYKKIKDIIKKFGEDPFAPKIAKAIVEYRKNKAIETTKELAHIVEQAYPLRFRKSARNHPATRTFQALRIFVNRELEELENFLRQIPFYLNPSGRVVIISFHSLEDRLVKRYFRYFEKGDERLNQRGLKFVVLTKKPLTPQKQEVDNNIRSRSAKMRVAEVI